MLAILVLTAAIAFAVSPLMVPGFNGFEPGQFPVPQEDPPAQPAGWAFSIWLLIYVWLIAGAGFLEVLPFRRRRRVIEGV